MDAALEDFLGRLKLILIKRQQDDHLRFAESTMFLNELDILLRKNSFGGPPLAKTTRRATPGSDNKPAGMVTLPTGTPTPKEPGVMLTEPSTSQKPHKQGET